MTALSHPTIELRDAVPKLYATLLVTNIRLADLQMLEYHVPTELSEGIYAAIQPYGLFQSNAQLTYFRLNDPQRNTYLIVAAANRH